MIDLILFIVTFCIIIYLWLTWNHDYWKQRGIPYVEPSLLFGTSKDLILMTKHQADYFTNIYKHYPNTPVVGLFKLRQPQLMIKDFEFAKIILSTQFNNFHDNDFATIESSNLPLEENPLQLNPFAATGEKWKLYRGISSRALTPSKIKLMVDQIVTVAHDMLVYVEVNQDKYLDGKYFAGQFTTDVTTSIAYGLQSNSFKDPNSTFRKMLTKVFVPDLKTNIMFIVFTIFPRLTKILKYKFIPLEVTSFYLEVIKDAIEYRKKNNIQRNDFLQQLIDSSKEGKAFTAPEILGHSMTFILDGYETSSVTLSQVLYQLAIYKPIQDKLREELQKNVDSIDKLNFDLIHSLNYLEAVISETLRLFPPGVTLMKLCTQNTSIHFKGKDYDFKKGLPIVIPVMPLQKDPKYFQDPEKFYPERFLENKDPPAFMPFGLGPRQCLGFKFALTQIKVALIALIMNYEVSPKNFPMEPIEFEPMSIFAIMKGGLWFKFNKI